MDLMKKFIDYQNNGVKGLRIAATVCIIFGWIFLFASLSSCSGVSARNNDYSYHDEIEKLMEQSKARERMQIMLVQLYTGMQLPVNDIDGFSKAIVDGIWEDYITECAVPIYQKYYSYDEIKALNKFYESPVGKKFAENEIRIGNECSTFVSQKFSERIQAIAIEYLNKQ